MHALATYSPSRRSPSRRLVRACLLVPFCVGAVGAIGPAGSATAAPAEPPAPIDAVAADDAGVPDAAPRYRVAGVIEEQDDLGPVGRGMNESGTIVGWINWPLDAFVWDDGDGLGPLPPLAGDAHHVAVDVNDTGMAVGHSGYETIEPPQHAVRWVDGVPQDLGTLPGGGDSHAEAINDAGMVVGWGYVGSNTHAFVWAEGAGMSDLTPTALNAYAYDINEEAQVTGYIGGSAFLWQGGQPQLLGAPTGFAYSSGFAINDAGVIAGSVTSASGNSERIARWTAGIGWEVLGGAGETNVAWGINNSGTIVGEGTPAGGLEQAIIYDDAYGMLVLGTLLDTTEWFLLSAYDIDDAGRIVALAHNRDSGEGATLFLEPVTATMTVDDLRVRLRGSDDLTGLARATVVDASGAPVAGATVVGNWSVDGEVVKPGDQGSTDAAGLAKIREALGDLSSGQKVRFCVTKITHPDYDDLTRRHCALKVVR